jgi:hypothetical protein
MQAIAKIFSPEVERWATRLHQRRKPGILLRIVFSQRLAWTHALMARFAHLPGLGFGSDKTLLRTLRAWMSRSHWFAPQTQVAWQTSITAAWMGRDRTLLLQPASVMFAERSTLLNTPLARVDQRQFTTLLNAWFIGTATQSHLRETTRHTLATMTVAGTGGEVATGRFPAGVSSRMRGAEGAGELEMPLVAKRVLRQNRRIEEQAAFSQIVLLQRSVPVVSEQSFVQPSVTPPVRPAAVSTVRNPNPVSQSFNINQITDEVVRQLDSRLVAARERFGKI